MLICPKPGAVQLESWLQRHEPIPFIGDDILLNFDNARALATLERLVELSTKTQVIFFTHHHHLVDLAKQHLATDKLILHELPTMRKQTKYMDIAYECPMTPIPGK